MENKENKYYTPLLEEFHCNTEYEVLYKGNWVSKNDWPNAYAYEDDPFYGLIKDLEAGNIRCKYLDKKDIEDLGFDGYEPPMEYNHLWKYKGSKEPKIYVWFNAPIPVVRVYGSFPQILFQGTIKNKSELKRILKQTGVL